MSIATAQRDPELRRHPLRSVRVAAAGGPYRFVAPRSSAELLRRSPAVVARAAAGDHPHWAEVWPASVALLRLLVRGPSLAGVVAFDLGCGVGVAGVGAGRAGARVTFADRAAEALAFARFNASQCGLADFAAVRFDWERDAIPDDVTLLLLADLAYQYRAVRSLLRHADAVLARGGRVLCADPFRPTGNDLFAGLVDRGADVLEARADDPGSAGARVAVRIADVGRRAG